MFNHPIGSNPTKKPMAKTPAATMEAEPDQMDGVDEQDADAIAQEHGPASEIHLQHEHEMGSHHVHSVHGDGHEHHSDHGSADKAHEHAKKLAGAGHAEHGEEGYEGEAGEY